MSKGNMLLGYSRGKVGDVVFQRLKGQQITKARNRNPNNPRTYAQMGQRVRLASCVDFYKRNREFFPFAFQDKSEKESEYNAFVKKNIGISPFYTKTEVTAGRIILAPYVMTYGELPDYGTEIVEQQEYETCYDIRFAYALNFPTMDDDKDVINEYLPQFLQPGQMLTFYYTFVTRVSGKYVQTDGYLQLYNNSGTIEQKSNLSYAKLSYGKLVGEEQDAYGFGFVVSLPFAEIGYSAAPQFAACIVLSEKNGSRLLVSPSTLLLNNEALDYYYTSHNADHLNEAAESYGEVSTALLDPDDASRYGAAIVPFDFDLQKPGFGQLITNQTLRVFIYPSEVTDASAEIEMDVIYTVNASSQRKTVYATYGSMFPNPTYTLEVPANCTKIEITATCYGFLGATYGKKLTKNFSWSKP